MQKYIVIVIKLAISGFVIFEVGRRIEVQQMISSLHNLDYFYLLIAIILAFLAVPVVAYRWSFLAKIFSVQIPIAVATRATFSGLFVGQVLPGAIGADVVRGWMIWNIGVSNKAIIASLVVDRIASLFAIVLMIGVSLPMLMPYLPEKIFIWAEWSFIGFIFFLLSSFIVFRLRHLIKASFSLDQFMHKLSMKNINISFRILPTPLILAVLGHCFIILSAYYLSLAIGIKSSLWMWGLVMPIIILATALPISINGWGIREFAMIHLWTLFGIAKSDAFLISICLGIVAIVSSLPGLWFWLEKKRNPSMESINVL